MPKWIRDLVSFLKFLSTPFMPALHLLHDILLTALKSEFLTKIGKFNLACLIIILMGETIAAINPLLYIFMKDVGNKIFAGLLWLIISFFVCMILVTGDNMYNNFLDHKYPNNQSS